MRENQGSGENVKGGRVGHGKSGPPLKFNENVEFQTALRQNADAYFQRTGRPKRGNWQIYLKASILLACFLSSYLVLVFFATRLWQGLALAVLLSFSMTGIGFNIMHDGGHRAFSDRKWVNKLAAMTLDLIGVSSYVWHWKHAMYHHNYVNIVGYDPDADVSILARFAPHRKRSWYHRWQHLYIWPFYAFLVAKLQLFTDFQHLISGRICIHPMPRPKRWDLATFVGAKGLFFILAFGLPLFFHSVAVVLFYYAITVLVMGVPLSVVFQLPHCTGRSEYPLPDEATRQMNNPWAVHQAQVTLDFDRRSRVRTWFFGGLNFHLEHHLFPSICHINYPGLSGIVEETCRQYGVKYREHPTFWSGLSEHYRWLKEMGKPETSSPP
jgi:linoleoyl-CoA desaturase